MPLSQNITVSYQKRQFHTVAVIQKKPLDWYSLKKVKIFRRMVVLNCAFLKGTCVSN